MEIFSDKRRLRVYYNNHQTTFNSESSAWNLLFIDWHWHTIYTILNDFSHFNRMRLLLTTSKQCWDFNSLCYDLIKCLVLVLFDWNKFFLNFGLNFFATGECSKIIQWRHAIWGWQMKWKYYKNLWFQHNR